MPIASHACSLGNAETGAVRLIVSYWQVEVYKHVLRSKSVAALMSGRASEPSDGVLSIITAIRKVCNHPDLLHSSSGMGVVLHCVFSSLST